MEDHRDTMRASAKKKEGQRHALPPQIFNGEKYCGDYEDFDVANEDDELEEFLGIPRKTPKVGFGHDLSYCLTVEKEYLENMIDIVSSLIAVVFLDWTDLDLVSVCRP